jgi:hypothetical protein
LKIIFPEVLVLSQRKVQDGEISGNTLKSLKSYFGISMIRRAKSSFSELLKNA